MLRRILSAVVICALCTAVSLFAQKPSARSSLAKAFDDCSSAPTIDEVAKGSQYALSGALDPHLIAALPSLDNSAGWSKAHYIIKGTLGGSVAKIRLGRRASETLPDPQRSSRLEVEPFTDDCDGLRERRGTDAESAFDDARLAADVLREVEDRGLALA
jgi:hypothetical protein